MRSLLFVAVAAACLASAAETKPYWLFIKTNGDKGYIYDGNIKLKAQWKYNLIALGDEHSQWRDKPSASCWISGSTGDVDLSKPFYEVASEDADPSSGTQRNMGEFPAYVFAYDQNITSVIFPRETKEVYMGAFYQCQKLTNVVFQSDNNLTWVYYDIFKNCTGLKTATLDFPNWSSASYSQSDMTNTFEYCTSLQSLTLNLPKLKTISKRMFRNCYKLESVTLNMPELETIDESAFDGCQNLSLLNMNCPKLKSIGYMSFQYCPLCRTDATKWNLPALTAVGQEAFLAKNWSISWSGDYKPVTYSVGDTVYTNVFPGPYGTVRLPVVQTIAKWAFGRRPKIDRYELGSNSVTSIGEWAFGQTIAKEVVIGNRIDSDISLGMNTFMANVANAENKVRFTGKMPTYENLTNMVSQLDNISRMKYYTIIGSSRRDASWKTVGVALTDEEKAFSPANTLGVLTFELNGKTHRCAWIVDEAMPGDKLAIRTEIDAPGWGVEMSAVPAADADGLVEDGAVVTLTVTNAPDAAGSFFRWYGDVGDGDRYSRTVTFTASGRDVWAMPVIDRPWTYDAAAGTIDNGDWAIYAYHPSSGSSGSLWIGKESHSSTYGEAIARAGTGILNLNGKITDADGTEWWIRRFAYASPLTGSTDYSRCAHAIVMPRTVTFIGNLAYFEAPNNATGYCYAGLRTLIVDLMTQSGGCSLAQDTESYLPTHFVRGQKFLRNLVLRMPRIRTARESALGDKDGIAVDDWFRGHGATELFALDVDAGDWYLPDLTTVGEGAFISCSGLRGKLSLPKVSTIADKAFDYCWKLERASLGSEKDSHLSSVGARAFGMCETLKDLELAVDPSLTVAENAFSGCAPTNVVLARLAPSSAALANILGDVTPAAGAKPCSVWGSVRVKETTYEALADKQLTAAEEAAKPTGLGEGTSVLGAFRVAADGDGMGRAWMMDTPNRYDRRGILLIVR